MRKKKKVVCLGGGIGTVNLIRGLRDHVDDITVVVSMADEGGSSGRLRRLYKVFPPGDLVSCMASLHRDSSVTKLLTYRFPGDRYGKDTELAGHKLGNLIMVALFNQTHNFTKSVEKFQRLFHIKGKFLSATEGMVSISARTAEGRQILGEENIDLGRYGGKRVLDQVFLHPKNARASSEVVSELLAADAIIAGPGDLYTTLLPVLIVPNIKSTIKKSKAAKVFVVNIANKPFETKGYSLANYVRAVKKHLGFFPFDTIIMNKSFETPIPKKLSYQYVPYKKESELFEVFVVAADLVDVSFPIYHSPQKLAKVLLKYL